jgi:hypothetical protein
MKGNIAKALPASSAIAHIHFRLAGVQMPAERAKWKAATDTDRLIAHMRGRLKPAGADRNESGTGELKHD